MMQLLVKSNKDNIMPIKSIDVKTLKSWLSNNEAIIVDVREPAEHEAESIPGSTLIPLGKMCKQALPDTHGKKLVVHCHLGGRSMTACEKLLAEDPNLEIYNLQGGMKAWTEVGETIQASVRFFLPLDRQVQTTIGGFILIATLLAWLISPWFLVISGFLGLGLIFAGLTGFCGLAVLMAKLPWNQKVGKTNSCTFNPKP